MQSALRRVFRSSLLATAVCLAPVHMAQAELITNGDFETGTFAGWTVANVAGGSGNWFIDAPGSTTPASGQTTLAAGGGAHGSFYAVSDQNGPGTHVLLQSFLVAPGERVVLSFDMFNNNYDAGPFFNGLDHNVTPNQHSRVDILSSSAGAFDTGAGVLMNVFLGGAPDGNPHPFTHFEFDISAAVAAGGTFQLRFGEVDNQLFFNMGVDNVSIQVPEPAPLMLLGASLSALLLWRRKRQT